MSVTDRLNDLAISVVVIETVKKSNASHDQPQNATYICQSTLAEQEMIETYEKEEPLLCI